jgi:hypothetical protein
MNTVAAVRGARPNRPFIAQGRHSCTHEGIGVSPTPFLPPNKLLDASVAAARLSSPGRAAWVGERRAYLWY